MSILIESNTYYEKTMNNLVDNISLGGAQIMGFNALTKEI